MNESSKLIAWSMQSAAFLKRKALFFINEFMDTILVLFLKYNVVQIIEIIEIIQEPKITEIIKIIAEKKYIKIIIPVFLQGLQAAS